MLAGCAAQTQLKLPCEATLIRVHALFATVQAVAKANTSALEVPGRSLSRVLVKPNPV